MRGAGTVIHRVRSNAIEGPLDRAAIAEVDGVPGHTRGSTWRRAARAMPRNDLNSVLGKEIDEVAAGETGRPGDESRLGHQRGIPPMPPLNGEKFPRPASVNDKKKRRSAGNWLLSPA